MQTVAVHGQRTHSVQAPIVQKVDSAIYRVNLYPVDSAIRFPNTYPQDSDLSDGWRFPTFEQTGPEGHPK